MSFRTAITSRLTVLRNLFRFLSRRGRRWMLPLVIIILALFLLVILGHSTPLGPFIYAIF